MSTPVLGPLAPWHLVLLALLAYRFILGSVLWGYGTRHLVLLALLAYRFMGGGGSGGRKVAASHISPHLATSRHISPHLTLSGARLRRAIFS